VIRYRRRQPVSRTLEIREAVKTAARKSGMTMGEWFNETLRAGRDQAPLQIADDIARHEAGEEAIFLPPRRIPNFTSKQTWGPENMELRGVVGE
jgi:hypothetical protein